MARFGADILSHVAKFEGGLSADPRDSASRNSSDYLMPSGTFKGLPVHTNKGVTFSTWQNYANYKGFPARSQDFINMTKDQWVDIAKSLYWNTIKGDAISSQGVAEILFEAVWGGGSKNLIRAMQRELNSKGYKGANGLGLSVDGAMGPNTLYALNNYTKDPTREIDMVQLLTRKRLDYLKSLSSWKTFGKGWTNRVIAMKDRALSLVGSTGGLATIFFLVGGYLTYKYFKKKK